MRKVVGTMGSGRETTERGSEAPDRATEAEDEGVIGGDRLTHVVCERAVRGGQRLEHFLGRIEGPAAFRQATEEEELPGEALQGDLHFLAIGSSARGCGPRIVLLAKVGTRVHDEDTVTGAVTVERLVEGGTHTTGSGIDQNVQCVRHWRASSHLRWDTNAQAPGLCLFTLAIA